MRRLMALGAVMLAILLAGLWVLAPPSHLPARFDAQECRRVAIIDNDGRAISGIEDIALTPDGADLILSAHDRLSPGTDGGIYRVSIFGLGAGSRISALRLSPLPEVGEVFRPHGIAVSPDGERLAVINRTDFDKAQVEIGTLTSGAWEVDRKLTGETLCRANDLAFTGGQNDAMFISLDRADCTGSLRDLQPGAKTGRIAAFDGANFSITRGRLAFPNGVVGPYIAETRANRLLRPGEEGIALPGAPDNLSLDAEDHLIVPVHPKLVHLWLYLKDWQSVAPGRILRVNPVTAGVEVLFDDPSGTMFSAPTSAVLLNGTLIAGSVRDEGLLICGEGVF